MNTLIAYFKEPRNAEKTIGALRDHGVSRRHLSLITGEENLDQLYTAAAAEKGAAEAALLLHEALLGQGACGAELS